MGRKRVQASIRIAVDDKPSGVKALILFLSPPGRDNVDAIHGDITDPAVRQQFKGSWRMPIEAIFHHLDRKSLELIALIPSADVGEIRGTIHEGDKFRNLVKRLTAGADGRPEIKTAAELLSDSTLADGVDFENADLLVRVTGRVWTALEDRGYRTKDILIDITGGQKTTTIAGAAVSLHELRQFQYVSTHDYRVQTFDIDYLPQES
jgi:hypothetical protein